MSVGKKKAYGFVLIGALGLLVLDRVAWLPTTAPQSAEASGGLSTAMLEVKQPAGPLVSVVAAPFPDQFPPFIALPGRRDVFALTDDVRGEMGVGSNSRLRESRLGPSGRLTPAGFRESYRLNAVLQSEGLTVAVVAGKWLRPGDELAGFKLLRVTGTSAIFISGKEEVTLSVIDDSTTPVPNRD